MTTQFPKVEVDLLTSLAGVNEDGVAYSVENGQRWPCFEDEARRLISRGLAKPIDDTPPTAEPAPRASFGRK